MYWDVVVWECVGDKELCGGDGVLQVVSVGINCVFWWVFVVGYQFLLCQLFVYIVVYIYFQYIVFGGQLVVWYILLWLGFGGGLFQYVVVIG